MRINQLLSLLTLSVTMFIGCSQTEIDSTSSTGSTSGTTTGSTSSTTTTATTVSECTSLSGIEKVVCLANALKSKLTSTQLATLQLEYSKANAIKWSNFPQALVSIQYKRVVLNFGSITAEQILYFLGVL